MRILFLLFLLGLLGACASPMILNLDSDSEVSANDDISLSFTLRGDEGIHVIPVSLSLERDGWIYAEKRFFVTLKGERKVETTLSVPAVPEGTYLLRVRAGESEEMWVVRVADGEDVLINPSRLSEGSRIYREILRPTGERSRSEVDGVGNLTCEGCNLLVDVYAGKIRLFQRVENIDRPCVSVEDLGPDHATLRVEWDRSFYLSINDQRMKECEDTCRIRVALEDGYDTLSLGVDGPLGRVFTYTIDLSQVEDEEKRYEIEYTQPYLTICAYDGFGRLTKAVDKLRILRDGEVIYEQYEEVDGCKKLNIPLAKGEYEFRFGGASSSGTSTMKAEEQRPEEEIPEAPEVDIVPFIILLVIFATAVAVYIWTTRWRKI